ncbi:MAG TPA: OmpA family protein [Polyangiaceae bacterium]|jgi:peptidoglycan-associated lipoprotein|nr:OmpA family protein [Polyangiaceae bacterium]
MRTFMISGRATMWLGCGAVALASAACSSDKTPARQPSDMAQAPASSAPPARDDADTTVQISDDFRRECQLPNAPQEAPHFKYADATLYSRGKNILDDVATCLSEGPLKGRTMTIIGRTDARGSASYNKQLSADRAGAARNYLVQHGVLTSNVRLIAQGEKGAQGNDDASWALDRRVDFELGDRTTSNNAAANNLDASPSPILEGTRIDGLSPGTASKTKAGSYSDTAEGGKETKAGK